MPRLRKHVLNQVLNFDYLTLIFSPDYFRMKMKEIIPTLTRLQRRTSSAWDLGERFLLNGPRGPPKRSAETAASPEAPEAFAESWRTSGGRWSTAGRRGRSAGRRRRLRESGWCSGGRPPWSGPTACLSQSDRCSQSENKIVVIIVYNEHTVVIKSIFPSPFHYVPTD